MNLMMMCSYCSSCLYVPVVLADFQVGGCSLRLHHVFQVEYDILDGICFDGGEQKIYCYCVDITLSETTELEEDEEFIIISVVYPRWPVSVLLLDYFLSVDSSS